MQLASIRLPVSLCASSGTPPPPPCRTFSAAASSGAGCLAGSQERLQQGARSCAGLHPRRRCMAPVARGMPQCHPPGRVAAYLVRSSKRHSGCSLSW